jgi:hypothetical protein
MVIDSLVLVIFLIELFNFDSARKIKFKLNLNVKKM